MEERLPTQEGITPEFNKSKKTVERSAAYPAITIEDALRFVGEVYKNFRNSFAKRDDIVSLIEGAHNRHVAAASYYGLLNRQKDSYQVSDLYKTVATPINETERRKALLEVFQSPNLNKELIDKFDGDVLPKEQQLIAHLSRFHRITTDAAPLAADVFIKNAKFCGVLDEANILNFKNVLLKLSDVNFQFAEVISEEKNKTQQQETQDVIIKNQDSSTTVLETKTPTTALLPEMVNEEKVKVRLTRKKFAYLIYPLDITKTDIQILKKEIEQLELTIE